MAKQKPSSFHWDFIYSSSRLEKIVKANIENKETSYYLFVSEWDEVSESLLNKLEAEELHCANEGGDIRGMVNVISTFEIPDGLGVIRSVIQRHKESISVAPLRSYSKIPMLVILHKAFPRVVDYNGSVFAELGL